jgi:hypothetical protein
MFAESLNGKRYRMSKRVIVTEFGEKCPYHDAKSHCYETGIECSEENCPLPVLPEEELIWYGDGTDDYEIGFNACLKAITGENKQ